MSTTSQIETEEELPFPNDTDSLFKEFNSDYTHNAIISSGMDKFFLFSDGYKTASIKLFEQLDGSAYAANTVVYPLVFLNRHFLELRLKELISGLNYVINHTYSFPNGHNLKILWDTYKILLAKVEEGKNIDFKIQANTERLILEFNSIDSSSFSFRYPVDTSTSRNPSLTIKNLDLKNFQATMTKLYNYFDSHGDMVFYLIDMTDEFVNIMRSEYEAEMRSYYGL
jgi:hypothetical protein